MAWSGTLGRVVQAAAGCLLAAVVVNLEGCGSRTAPARPDTVAVAPEAGPVSTSGRRRRRRRLRSTVASAERPPRPVRTGSNNVNPPPSAGVGAGRESSGGNEAEFDLPEPDEPPERRRPRVTESGPMLPEDLGRPQNVSMDMTENGAASGPMGLEPSEISRGMNPLLGRFANCADATDDNGHGAHGRVSVRLRIHNDGRPVAARVSGGGGPAEFVTCARRVVASARFSRFNGPDVFASWGFDVD